MKLGWGPRLEDLTDAAARFRSEHGLEECILGRDGQLILKAEGDPAYAARLVRDFHDEVMRGKDFWLFGPGYRPYSLVNARAPWFLVVTSRPWEPDDSFSRCIATEEPAMWHIGTAPRFEYSQEAGMYIWRGPEPVRQQASSPSEEEDEGEEPLFSPEGDEPDFIEIEEQ